MRVCPPLFLTKCHKSGAARGAGQRTQQLQCEICSLLSSAGICSLLIIKNYHRMTSGPGGNKPHDKVKYSFDYSFIVYIVHTCTIYVCKLADDETEVLSKVSTLTMEESD